LNKREESATTLYKKGDKLNCNNYRGISLLNSAYKVFSKILLKYLEPIADGCIGKFQSCFRKGKLTIDQIAIVEQSIEKKIQILIKYMASVYRF